MNQVTKMINENISKIKHSSIMEKVNTRNVRLVKAGTLCGIGCVTSFVLGSLSQRKRISNLSSGELDNCLKNISQLSKKVTNDIEQLTIVNDKVKQIINDWDL